MIEKGQKGEMKQRADGIICTIIEDMDCVNKTITFR